MQIKILTIAIAIFILLVNHLPNCSCFDRSTYAHLRLRTPTYLLKDEHVSPEYYKSLQDAATSKESLQQLLHNFLEILQRNLTTSAILESHFKSVDLERTQRKLSKINSLADFFKRASFMTEMFAKKSEYFFQISKNQSNDLLLKLRQVPSAERSLPTQVKVQLTLYFAEMEFFHVMFSEIIDEALEYIVDTLRFIHLTFSHYADVQSDVLRYWYFKGDEWCCNQYMDFLQKWSAYIYKCAADKSLNAIYDVYAMTEMEIKHIIFELKFRIERLYNCFLFGEYEIRCGFLRNAESDFEKLFVKLEELQMYVDIKTNRGRVNGNRYLNHRQQYEEVENNVEIQDKCIPYGFPENQMLSSLRSCFNYPQLN